MHIDKMDRIDDDTTTTTSTRVLPDHYVTYQEFTALLDPSGTIDFNCLPTPASMALIHCFSAWSAEDNPGLPMEERHAGLLRHVREWKGEQE